MLELAAGPARHSLTALADSDCPVEECRAVDASPEMAAYAAGLATEKLGGDDASAFGYAVADVRRTTAADVGGDGTEPFDAAWMLLGSLQHLSTNADALDMLRSVGSLVRSGGTLVLELPHPRELFSLVECTRNGWTVPLESNDEDDHDEGGELEVVWGDDDDVFCPVTQIRHATVELRLTYRDGSATRTRRRRVREVVPMRHYTAQEVDALAVGSGCWSVAAMYGALDADVKVTDDEAAYRLVCVLRRS